MYVYMAPPLKVVLESQTFCILRNRRLGLHKPIRILLIDDVRDADWVHQHII